MSIVTSVVILFLFACVYLPEMSTHLQLHFLLNRDTEKFSSFLKGIDIPDGCGGDAPEDISSGLKVVTENLTWGHGTKAREVHINMYLVSYNLICVFYSEQIRSRICPLDACRPINFSSHSYTIL